MQRYNIFEAMYLSFFSKDLYRDVVKNWGGKIFLYLLTLIALSWLILAFPFQKEVNRLYAKKADKLLPQFPVLTIEKGVISTPEKRPYIIIDPDDNNRPIIMIDTTGKNTSLIESKTDMLMTNNAILMKSNATEMNIYKIPSTLNVVLEPDTIKSFLQKSVSYAWIIFVPLFILFSYIYRFFQALINAIIGKIFSAIMKIPLTLSDNFKMAIIALSPVIIVGTFLSFFQLFTPFTDVLFLAVSIAYLFYGILANAETEKTGSTHKTP